MTDAGQPNRQGTDPLPSTYRVYRFGPFTLDVAAVQLLRESDAVALTSRAFDTLVVLLRFRDRVVSKEELMALVWPRSFVSEDSLAHNISVLRRALGDDSNQPAYIATVPRRGYRFVGEVTESDHAGPTPQVQDADVQEPAPMPALDEMAPAREPTPVVVEPADRLLAMSRRARWGAAVLLVAAIAAGAAWISGDRSTADEVSRTQPVRFAEFPPSGTRLVENGVVSPDGRHMVMVAQTLESGRTNLWLRDLAGSEPRMLPDTEDAMRPFWAPDSQWVGFISNYRVRRTSLRGDSATTIATIGVNTTGATWGADGRIMIGQWREGILTVPAAGGKLDVLTVPDRKKQEAGHRAPQLLPGGRALLHIVPSANPTLAGTYVLSFDDDSRVRVLDIPAVYADGHLLFIRDHALMAQPFDVARKRVTGTPLIIDGNVGAMEVDTTVSGAPGVLAYRPNTRAGRLVWFDRAGTQLGVIETPLAIHNPRLTPDGRQLLGNGGEAERRVVWMVDLERGSATAVADGAGPIASPDGQRYMFVSDRSGVADIYVKATVGDGESVLLTSPDPKTICDWSQDSRYVVFTSRNLQTRNDIWVLEMSDSENPAPYLNTPANEIQAQISPDGQWLAYASDESGSWEVYVQSFPLPGKKRTLSVGGGAQPTWRGDGRELFYLAPDGRVMSVPIRPGATLEAGRPQEMFRAPIAGNLGNVRSHYVVTADGQRFLFDAVDPSSGQTPITVVVNWRAAMHP